MEYYILLDFFASKKPTTNNAVPKIVGLGKLTNMSYVVYCKLQTPNTRSIKLPMQNSEKPIFHKVSFLSSFFMVNLLLC